MTNSFFIFRFTNLYFYSKYKINPMKKIALVVNQWDPSGGVEQVGNDIVHALNKSDIAINLLSFKDSSINALQLVKKIKTLNPSSRVIKSLIYRLKLYRYFEIVGAHDIKECNCVIFTHLHCLLRLRSFAFSENCILWLHGLEVWGDRAVVLTQFIQSKLKIVCVSNFTAQHVSRYFPSERITVIPNVVDTTIFKPTDTPNLIRHREILIVSRLQAGRPKGHDILLKILPKLSRDLKQPIRLIVAGEGNDKSRLESLAADLGVSESVSFLGRVSDDELINLFQHAGVFCMPAPTGQDSEGRWFGEGFGIVYIQAAACGRPVIASSQGGAPETIICGETGFAVDPNNENDLLEKLFDILSSPSLADSMGCSGRKLAEARFSFESLQKFLTNTIE
jgi:glycosyltransferase involved in cell wall biosynthesis